MGYVFRCLQCQAVGTHHDIREEAEEEMFAHQKETGHVDTNYEYELEEG